MTDRYLEQDANDDLQLYFAEDCDLSCYSMVPEDGRETYTDVEEYSSMHLKNLDYLHSAKSILESEITNSRKRRDSWELVNVDLDQGGGSLIFPMTIPVSKIILNEIEKAHLHSLSNNFEAKVKQLKKDIERDKLLVNNERLIGAVMGLGGIVDKLSCIIDEILENCSLPALLPEIKERFVYALLLKASRTHSGSMVFNALRTLVNLENTLILPQSSVAPPIRIQIMISSLRNPNQLEVQWGLVGKICCDFVYLVQKRADVEVREESAPSQSSLSLDAIGEYKVVEHLLTNQSLGLTFEDCVSFPINLAHQIDDGGLIDDPVAGKVIVKIID